MSGMTKISFRSLGFFQVHDTECPAKNATRGNLRTHKSQKHPNRAHRDIPILLSLWSYVTAKFHFWVIHLNAVGQISVKSCKMKQLLLAGNRFLV
jgi:hypothetical protein